MKESDAKINLVLFLHGFSSSPSGIIVARKTYQIAQYTQIRRTSDEKYIINAIANICYRFHINLRTATGRNLEWEKAITSCVVLPSDIFPDITSSVFFAIQRAFITTLTHILFLLL